MDAFYAAPPIIRTLTLITVLESLAVNVGPVHFASVVYIWPYIAKMPPELWRFATAFFLTGPNLSIIIEPYMLYTNGKRLEVNTPRFARKGDFVTYILFVATVITIVCGGILGGMAFLPPLIMAFCYTLAQENPEQQVTLFIFDMTNKWMPWAMLALTLIMAGPKAAWEQATGIVAAHLYEFLTRLWPRYGGGTNIVITPRFLHQAFGDHAPGPKSREFGTVYAPRPGNAASASSSSATASGSSTGATTTGATNRWGTMGPGRRLG